MFLHNSQKKQNRLTLHMTGYIPQQASERTQLGISVCAQEIQQVWHGFGLIRKVVAQPYGPLQVTDINLYY